METQRERIHRKNKARFIVGRDWFPAIRSHSNWDACNMFATSFFSLFAGTIAEHVGDGGCWNPLGVWVATVPATCSLRTYNVNSRTRTVVSLLPHLPRCDRKAKAPVKENNLDLGEVHKNREFPRAYLCWLCVPDSTLPNKRTAHGALRGCWASSSPGEPATILYQINSLFFPGVSPSSSGFPQLFSNFHQFSPGFHQVFKDPCVLFPLDPGGVFWRPGGDLGRPQHADHGGAALQERGAVGAAGRAQGVWTGKVGVRPV